MSNMLNSGRACGTLFPLRALALNGIPKLLRPEEAALSTLKLVQTPLGLSNTVFGSVRLAMWRE